MSDKPVEKVKLLRPRADMECLTWFLRRAGLLELLDAVFGILVAKDKEKTVAMPEIEPRSWNV